MVSEMRPHENVRLLELAGKQGGVLSRAQLTELKITRWMVRDQLTVRRWRRLGKHTIAVVTGDLPELAQQWRAVWESGRVSALDGVSALVYEGLTGFEVPEVQVSVPHGRSPIVVNGVERHVVGIRHPQELFDGDMPCVRPEVAVLRAAQWVHTDRQAALVMTMAAQQRLLDLNTLLDALKRTGLHWRRALIRTLVADVTDGVHALGELDFAGACRRAGLPEPERQSVCEGSHGRYYLDTRWREVGLVVEIDGIQHLQGLGPVDDALRQNVVTMGDDRVLRIPVLGWRIREDDFMRQVVEAYDALSRRHAA